MYPLPGYGEIAYSPDGKPICHICEKAYKKPLTHARQIHGLTEKEYKKEFGLNVTVGILSEESRELARKRAYENYDVVIVENLLKKGKKTRFKKGSQGRVKEKVSEQTRRALVERIKNAKKSHYHQSKSFSYQAVHRYGISHFLAMRSGYESS